MPSDEKDLGNQVRGAVLAGIAALAGWSGITTVSLLVQNAALSTHIQQVEKRLESSIAAQQKAQEDLTSEIRAIRTLIEGRVSYGNR